MASFPLLLACFCLLGCRASSTAADGSGTSMTNESVAGNHSVSSSNSSPSILNTSMTISPTSSSGECTMTQCPVDSTVTTYMYVTMTITDPLYPGNQSSTGATLSNSRIPPTTTSAPVSVATPIEMSPSVADSTPPLQWIEENVIALAVGLGIGLLLGCCVCCVPVTILCCKRKKEVYSIEAENGKKSRVKFQEKTSVRVEEISLDNVEDDKSATKESSTPGEGDREPLDSKKEEQQSPSDVVIVDTASKEGKMVEKEKEKEDDISPSDSATKVADDSKLAAPSGQAPTSKNEETSPMKGKKSKDKEKAQSKDKEKAHSKDKGKVHSKDKGKKTDSKDKGKKTQSDVETEKSSPLAGDNIPVAKGDDLAVKDKNTNAKGDDPITDGKTPSATKTVISPKDENTTPSAHSDAQGKGLSTSQSETASSTKDEPSSLVEDKVASNVKDATTTVGKTTVSGDKNNTQPSPTVAVTKQSNELNTKKTDQGELSLMEATKETNNTPKVPATIAREQKTAATPSPKQEPKKDEETSVRQESGPTNEAAAPTAVHSGRETSSKQQPKQSGALPGSDDIDALLQDVLNWKIGSS